jgi:RNA polymerase sigma-70 factor (ECF subfamily)
MSEGPSFDDLILRVRAGDDEAAAQLVRRYEPAIRRAVRVRMRDPRLRRQFDSADVCQSVLACFFVRAALGRYELDTPEKLLTLLASMARNRLANRVNRERAGRRDHRRVEAGADGQEVAAAGATPSGQLAARELLEEARRRLSPEERRLAELRQEGREWAEIAALVGGTADALRKKLARAADRVAAELGLDEVDHE